MKKNLFLVVALLMVASLAGMAQDRKAVKINEVMVQNVSNVVDEYGNHGAWIELFNSNFGPVNISSIYLTNDSTNSKKYAVPIGDVKTKIAKRQHVIFWADNQHTKGTFHTNFTLVPGQENWVGIYDADGKLIDSVTIPASLCADQSYARVEDGSDEWGIRTGVGNNDESCVTPCSANIIKGENPKIKDFSKKDERGFGMTVMAMFIVFSALLVLCLCFYAIGAIGKSIARHNKARATGVEVTEIPRDQHDSGEEIAAIAMALNEHFNKHDNESFILTVKKMKRAYSPWSSKIYGLREIPQRRK